MQGLVSVWRILSPTKRVMLIGAVAATIFMFSLLARTASTPSMSLLYAGLDGRTAGEVVAALQRMDTPYDIRGEAIFVPSTKRDAIRMSLAGEGLPQQGQAGYELLDKLNGFATTSDMFDATYWRAKEGELARTILASPGVRAARVHIAAQHAGPFARNTPAPTGVVTVTMGQSVLDGSQAQAIRYLVAAAVPGLLPEGVAVIDSARGVVLSPGATEAGDQKTAADRESKLEADILNILEARVGAGNARVQVALDLDMEREAVSERVFNPDGRVISGKETTEVSETTQGSGSSSSAVSVASNLPENGAGGGGGSSTQRTETKETINYDMSEVKRERQKLPGSIRRLSVAVFINQIAEQPEEEGAAPVLRTPEELATLKQLVAQAAGFNEARGDTISIESLPFQPLSNDGTLAEENPFADFMQQHMMNAIQIVVLSIVTLILGLFVVKPLLAAKGAPPAAAPQAGAAPALAGAQPAAELAPAAPDAIETLKVIASTKSDQTATLIKSWLETAEDAA